MSSQATAPRQGYLLCEDTHSQIMRGLDSLRLIEGLACSASNSAHRSEIDMEELAGFLQLLLSQTRQPLKGLQWAQWVEIKQVAPPLTTPTTPSDLTPEEQQLLLWHRQMPSSDREHLLGVVEAMVGLTR